ncbi:MAG: hypothetical protein KC593_01720 [Myxococcales bacterium]|nr:hypothetical protein [Myxococcales bacterium]
MLTREHDYSFGPWPQPAPDFFEDGAPAVLNVPEDVQKDWDRHVGRRYIKQVLLDTVPSWLWARRNPGLRSVSDERFCELLCDGIFSKFLFPRRDPNDPPRDQFDAPDERLFAAYLDGSKGPGLEPGEAWFKSDFTPMRLVPSDADSSTVPSVVLFKRRADRSYQLVAIALDQTVFDPSHEGGWVAAKYFALQGAGVITTLLMHPKLHFPSNAIDAITRTRLSPGSTLKQLLLPHFRLAMAVNYAVLYGNETVLKPGKIYAPYPGTLEQHAEIVATLWRGLDHPDGTPNRAYPRYRFPMEAPEIHSPYGTFLGRYHETLLAFGRKVAPSITAGRPHEVAEWARHCAAWVPGFPDASRIFDEDVLARVFASIVLDVGVSHSADHYIYGQVDPREVPFRLHMDVPSASQRVAPDPTTLVTVRDNLNYKMCSLMFFAPYVVERLPEIDYGFADPTLRQANAEFRSALAATESSLINDGVPRYVPLHDIATSVQF